MGSQQSTVLPLLSIIMCLLKRKKMSDENEETKTKTQIKYKKVKKKNYFRNKDKFSIWTIKNQRER